MAAEVFGAGIRIPAYVNGFPMKCIGVAHAASVDGKRDVWITVIMSANGACPQSVVVPTATPTGVSGFPTRTATPTHTATPKATPPKSPTPAVFKLRMQAVASDGGE